MVLVIFCPKRNDIKAKRIALLLYPRCTRLLMQDRRRRHWRRISRMSPVTIDASFDDIAPNTATPLPVRLAGHYRIGTQAKDQTIACPHIRVIIARLDIGVDRIVHGQTRRKQIIEGQAV